MTLFIRVHVTVHGLASAFRKLCFAKARSGIDPACRIVSRALFILAGGHARRKLPRELPAPYGASFARFDSEQELRPTAPPLTL